MVRFRVEARVMVRVEVRVSYRGLWLKQPLATAALGYGGPEPLTPSDGCGQFIMYHTFDQSCEHH